MIPSANRSKQRVSLAFSDSDSDSDPVTSSVVKPKNIIPNANRIRNLSYISQDNDSDNESDKDIEIIHNKTKNNYINTSHEYSPARRSISKDILDKSPRLSLKSNDNSSNKAFVPKSLIIDKTNNKDNNHSWAKYKEANHISRSYNDWSVEKENSTWNKAKLTMPSPKSSVSLELLNSKDATIYDIKDKTSKDMISSTNQYKDTDLFNVYRRDDDNEDRFQPSDFYQPEENISPHSNSSNSNNSSNSTNSDIVSYISDERKRKPPINLPKYDIQSFISIAHIKDIDNDLIQCIFLRDKKSSIQNKLFPTFELLLERTLQPLILAKKIKLTSNSNYHLYDLTRGNVSNNLTKKSGNYIGKLRSKNMKCNEYTFVSNISTNSCDELIGILQDSQSMLAQFTENSLPREISVVIPKTVVNIIPIPHQVSEVKPSLSTILKTSNSIP